MMPECIERTNLIARIRYYLEHTPVNCGEHYAYSVALKEVLNCPAADVAPVAHGCFEPCFDENGNWRQGFAKCSNCGKEYYAQVINHFGYCPNCGAKMDGGDNDAANGNV